MNVTNDIAHSIAQLPTLTVTQLRQRYAELFGEITQVGNKQWLVKRIAWRWQAQAEGDLSERARLRALHLATDADLRLNPPKVLPDIPAPAPDPSPPAPVLGAWLGSPFPLEGNRALMVAGDFRPGSLQLRGLCHGGIRARGFQRGLRDGGLVVDCGGFVCFGFLGSHV